MSFKVPDIFKKIVYRNIPVALEKSKQAHWLEAMNPLRGISITEAQNIFDMARRGCYARLDYLYNEIESVDPTLLVCVERRESELTDLDWDIAPTDERTAAGRNPDEKLAEEQKECLENAFADCANLDDAMARLQIGFFRGHAHVSPNYSADGMAVKSFDILDGWNFCHDFARDVWQWNAGATMTEPGENNKHLEDIPPGELVTLARSRHIDYPGLSIYIRAALGERKWGQFLERFGIPPAIITMPEFSDKGEEDKYMKAAAKVAAGASGALPFGSTVNFASEARGVNPFTQFVDHQQQLIVLLATGGLLTSLSAPGSGTLAGNAHQKTWEAIVRRDGRLVGNAINRQCAEVILERAYPGKPKLMQFKVKTEAEPTTDEVLEHAAKMTASGYRISIADIRARTGYEIEAIEAGDNKRFPSVKTESFFVNRQNYDRTSDGKFAEKGTGDLTSGAEYSAEELKEEASKYADEYAYVGIRTQDEPFELGEMTHQSHNWNDGEDTGDQLDGVSATSYRSPAIRAHAQDKKKYSGGYYPGEYVAIIGGHDAEYGADVGELVIKEPVVLKILRTPQNKTFTKNGGTKMSAENRNQFVPLADPLRFARNRSDVPTPTPGNENAPSAILGAFSEDMEKVNAEVFRIVQLDGEEQRTAAAELIKKLPELMPEKPHLIEAMEKVIAEQFAQSITEEKTDE